MHPCGKILKQEPIREVHTCCRYAVTFQHFEHLAVHVCCHAMCDTVRILYYCNYITLKFSPYHKNKKDVHCILLHNFTNKSRVAKKSSYLRKPLLSILKVKMASCLPVAARSELLGFIFHLLCTLKMSGIQCSDPSARAHIHRGCIFSRIHRILGNFKWK